MFLMDLLDQINTHKYLYLDRLYEEKDLELCVVVDEAKILGGESETLENASQYGAIASDYTCKKYKIVFRNYAAYLVTNEIVASGDNEEEFTGKLLRTYSKSKFLEYLASTTNGAIDVLGPCRHYEVVTLNQIIDVAATREPEIEIVPSTDAT
jgi:vacuolar-type H+-ATPase subunit I/STV1